jgi:thiamine-monophosphate kinase
VRDAIERDQIGLSAGRTREAAIVVSDVGEFALIDRILARVWRGGGEKVVVAPGDDATVLATEGARVVASTDLLVDGVHFRRDWSTATDIGHRAAAANLADIAAMGATPIGLLVGLGLPGEVELEWVDGLADGLRDECSAAGALIVGGDVVRSPTITVSATAIGTTHGQPVLRSGARAGDVVVVAGRIGFAAAGLALLQAGQLEHPLADAHRRPQVAYAAALRLAELGATSMIDVSDGLVADLRHVATASGVRVELTRDDLPLDAALVDAGLAIGVDPLTWVAGGGDDHAFVATLPPDAALRAVARVADLPEPVPFAQIGRVVTGSGVVFIDGDAPQAHGHAHFS